MIIVTLLLKGIYGSPIFFENVLLLKHIPHTGNRKLYLIPGWDSEMDSARQTSLFWHTMWKECGRGKSGIVYDIMKMCQSNYQL